MPQPQPVNRRKRFFVELSRTQLLITIAASLFILSWVFILGIIVGRGIVADTITQAMKAQISKLQQEKKALVDKYMPPEQPQAGPQGEILKPQLDFYDQLGKKNQDHLVMTTPKPTAPPPTATTPPATVLTPSAAEKPAEKTQTKVPAPPSGPASSTSSPGSTTMGPASPAPVPPATKPADKAQGKIPPPPPGPASPVQAVPAPPAAKPADPVLSKTPPPSAAAETSGAFTLQLGSYREEHTAQTVAQRLSSKGYQPKVSSKDIPEKGGRWFRVRLGPFKTRTEADNVLKKLEQDGFQAMVISKKD